MPDRFELPASQHGSEESPARYDLLGERLVSLRAGAKSIFPRIHGHLRFHQVIAPESHRLELVAEQLKSITIRTGECSGGYQLRLCATFAR
jgi:hypothetical protein